MALTICPMCISKAKEFITAYHRHNKAPVGGLFSVGLAEGGEVVGVAVVGRPVARRLDDGATAEVTRVCIVDGLPKGANSMLYGACWRAAKALGYRKLITYTLQSESGASLRGAGWRVVAELDGRKSWSCPSRHRETMAITSQPKLRWEAPDA